MRHGWMTVGVTAAISTRWVPRRWGSEGASAGGSASITGAAATATCDGVVTAEYSYDLSAGQGLGAVGMLFTLGADSTSQSLRNMSSTSASPNGHRSASASGYSPGDIVIVDVSASLNPAEADAFGTTTVEIPECPVVTDAPTTDAPVETEAPADTRPRPTPRRRPRRRHRRTPTRRPRPTPRSSASGSLDTPADGP